MIRAPLFLLKKIQYYIDIKIVKYCNSLCDPLCQRSSEMKLSSFPAAYSRELLAKFFSH